LIKIKNLSIKASFLIIILIIIIFFSSYIIIKNNNDNEKIKYAESSDLKLTIELDNQSLNNGINLTIKLININNIPIKILKYFHEGLNFLEIYITGPNNTNLTIISGHDEFHHDYIILKPNEFLIENISLKDDLNVTSRELISNGSYRLIKWNWDTKGKYIVWVVYEFKDPNLYSNSIEFEIKR